MVLSYSHKGEPEKVVLGPYPEISLKRAKEKRNEFAVQVADGRSPAEEKRQAKLPNRASPTFREFGERYYSEQVQKNWKDPSNERRNLEKYLYPALGNGPWK